MNRRSFLASLGAAAGALILPHEPKRIYAFGEDVGRISARDRIDPNDYLYRSDGFGLGDVLKAPYDADLIPEDGYDLRVTGVDKRNGVITVTAIDRSPMARIEQIERLLTHPDEFGNPAPLITREHAIVLLGLG